MHLTLMWVLSFNNVSLVPGPPFAFFSKKLSSAESKYSTFNRELLAAYSSIRNFRFLLEG